jgi:glutaredoxin 3
MQRKSKPINAEVWSQTNCPACTEAKRLLDLHKIHYGEKMLGINGYTKKDLIEKVPNARSVPQIFLDGKYVGGLPELKRELAEYDNYYKADVE